MSWRNTVRTLPVLLACGLAAVALWRSATHAGGAETSLQEGPPRPGPHHEHLKMEEGVWDANLKITPGPDAPVIESKGVETNTIGAGGLWLITDFKSDFMGEPFHGHGLLGYDAKKMKYASVWVDSMQDYLMVSEGTCDGTGKVRTMFSEHPDETGKVRKWKEVTEIPDKDTRTFTLSMLGDDQKYQPIMTIQYKRRK